MIAFLQFLAALIVAVQPSRAPFDLGGALMSLAFFGGGSAVMGFVLRGIVARAADDRARIGWIGFASNVGRVAALVAFWGFVQRHGTSQLAGALGIAAWPVAPLLLSLTPFFLLSAIVRTAIHPAASAAEVAPVSLVRSLVLDAKMALLPLAPVVLFAIVLDLAYRADRTSWWGRMWSDVGDLPSVRAFAMLGIAAVGLLFMPSILRKVWRCKPLPPGPLRDRLEAYAARVGLKTRELLVWPTGGDHVNAAVIGIVPRFRYVFFTDGLLETLEPDEIEAVFAHEAGHARRGHLLLFLGFTGVLGFAGFLPGAVLGPLESLVEPVPAALRVLLLIVLWLGVVFGWVSRRFEQEADVYGIETLPPAPRADGTPTPPEEHPFARALERIADVAGGIREVTGWRHFSIAQRIDFVRDYLTDPAVRRAYRRQILAIRGAVILLVVVAAGFTVARIPFDIRESRGRRMLEELNLGVTSHTREDRAVHFARAAEAARRAGRPAAALRWIGEAALLQPTPEILRDYALLLEEAGRPLGARTAWEQLAARDDAPAALRESARAHATSLAGAASDGAPGAPSAPR